LSKDDVLFFGFCQIRMCLRAHDSIPVKLADEMS
jgi:hypothetical protein